MKLPSDGSGKGAKTMKYMDYILETMKQLLAIPSPSGFTREAADFIMKELQNMGYEPQMTLKRGVVCDLGGEDAEDGILLAAHIDTLGAVVREIKSNGRLKLINVGGLRAANVECENCLVHTHEGKAIGGVVHLINASTHVNENYNETHRTFDTVELLLDEYVNTKAEVEALGIMVGDFVSFDPRTMVTESGFIKSRFLDDKLCAAVLLGYAKYLKEEGITPKRRVHIGFTSYEEVGHGGAADIPAGVKDMISVDMGCVGEGLQCDETMVSICAKDAGGPYDYELNSDLIRLAKENNLRFVVDVFTNYSSDVNVSVRAGHNLRHACIGPGVYASHSYERSHKMGVEATFELIRAYLG